MNLMMRISAHIYRKERREIKLSEAQQNRCNSYLMVVWSDRRMSKGWD